MNHKAVMLVVLLIAGISLAAMPAGSSAASGVHPGGCGTAEGITVTYDGSSSPGSMLIQLEKMPGTNNISAIVMSDESVQEFPALAAETMFILKLDQLPYGKSLVSISEYQGQEIAQCYIDIVDSYKVSMDANGGKGSMAFMSVKAGSMLTIPECTFTAPEGASFTGWQINGTMHQPGETISIGSDITLKASWSGGDVPEKGGLDPVVIVIAAVVIVIAAILVFVLIRRGSNGS